MTTFANRNSSTTDELDDVELDRVSGGESNLIHAVAVAVANTVAGELIKEAYGFGAALKDDPACGCHHAQ